MSGLQNLSLEQAAVLIASHVRVKQADIEKQAVPAWGGQHISFAPKNKGIGLTAGYDYLAGTIPIPYLGLDIGGQDHGVSLSGPVPGIGARAGFMSRPPGVTRHIANHRSLWKTIGDSLAGRDREDFLQQEYGPHRAAVFQNMKDKDLLRAMPRITGDDADYAKLPADRQQFLKELAKAIRDPKTYAADDDEILVDDPALLESKTASGRVKQAVESTTKPEYSQTLQQPVTQPDPSRNATSPAGGAPGIMDRIRAALSNIDFGSLANKGMDAAKGFSPGSNPLHAALLGGGLGMGVGALGSLTSSDKEKRKRWLRNALFGGAMGGLGGAGLGAAINYGNKLMTDESARQKAEMDKPQTPVLTDHASHVSGTVADTLSGKNLPSMADILKLRDRAGTAIYNAGAPVVDKLQSAYNDPAGFLEAFRRSTVKPFADDPVGGVSAVANKVKGGIGEVGNALSDVANNPDAFKQSLIDTVGKHQGLLVPGGAVAGAMAANALNNRATAKHQQQMLQTSAANPKFTPFVTGKDGVNAKLRASGHPEVTPQQLAVMGGVQPAKGVPKPPALRPPQVTAMNTAVKAFNPTATPPKPRSRMLWGAGGAVLGGLLNAAYTPHLSQAQKQQQAATLPTLQ